MGKAEDKRILSDAELDTIAGGAAKTDWIAVCQECQWSYSCGDAAVLDAQAAQHTRETGHRHISKSGKQG